MRNLARLLVNSLIGVVCATIPFGIVALVLPGVPAFWLSFGFAFIAGAVVCIMCGIQSVGEIEKTQEAMDDQKFVGD